MVRRALWAASLVMLAATPLPGQIASAGAEVHRYTFAEPEIVGLESFTLTTTPFSAGFTVGGVLGLDVSSAWAEGVARGPEGGEARLSGPTDTRIGLALLLGRDRVVLSSTVTLPTGEDMLTLEEGIVAGVVATELLPLPISAWGAGAGAGGDLAVAFQAGEWGIGLSGGYWASREFEPIPDNALVYRPGDQTRVRLALDRDVGSSGTFSVLFGVSDFDDDEIDDMNLFRAGTRIEGGMSYAFAAGARGSALLYGGVFHRAEGQLLLEASDLIGATGSASQQLYYAGTNLLLPLGSRAMLLPDVNLRVFRSGDGIGQGWLTTVGTTLDLRIAGRAFGRTVTLSPTARARFGRVFVRTDAESDINGFEFGVTLRTEPGR